MFSQKMKTHFELALSGNAVSSYFRLVLYNSFRQLLCYPPVLALA